MTLLNAATKCANQEALVSELGFEYIKSATRSLRGLRRRMDAKATEITREAQLAVSKQDRGAANVMQRSLEPCFNEAVIEFAVMRDICAPSNSTLPLNFSGVINMADQSVEAAEILQSTQALFTKHLLQFNETADKTVKEAKQRISQITDYTNRLGTSLSNLNKVLGDERMVRALENADKIATALKALDTLQQSGNLDKIIAALQAK